MTRKWQPVHGVKWFKDIVKDSNRQYGVEVHEHLPQRDIVFKPFGDDGAIRLPEDTELINHLRSRFGDTPVLRKYPDAYAATIQDGTLVGNSGMVITPDGYIIAETASLTGYRDYRCLSIQDLQKTNLPLQYEGHLNGNVLSVANPNGGYGHHLVESFFSMIWFNNCPINYIHVAEGPNYRRMSEFLCALQIPTESMVQAKLMEFRTASAVSFFGPNSFYLLRKETIDRVEDLLVKPRRPNVDVTKKIYMVTRAKSIGAKNRILSTENELQLFLVNKGYECIDPALYDIEEKIKLFSQVSHVVSCAGSGSYNAFFFTPPNVTIAHIMPPEALVTAMLNCIGNQIVISHTDTSILPIYRDFCFHNNRLMTSHQMSKFQLQISYHEMTQHFGEFYPNLDGSINLEKFDKFIALLTNI